MTPVQHLNFILLFYSQLESLGYLKGLTTIFSEHWQEGASYYFTSEGSHHDLMLQK